jgi:hypothetical protein
VQILHAWRHNIRALPPALAAARRETLAVRSTRITPSSSPSFRERCAQHVRELAESALRECRYRRAHSRWIDVVHSVSVTVADDEPPTLVGDTATTWHRRHAWRALSTTWRATVRPSWLRVHRVCGGRVDGCFVLELLEPIADGGWRVLAGRQGRGYSINVAPARISRQAPLAWRLQWE